MPSSDPKPKLSPFQALKTNPEVDNAEMINNRLRLANRTNASLRMRSSEQLKGCLRFPEPTPAVPPAAAGAPSARSPVYTRTMLLERRRQERTHDEVQLPPYLHPTRACARNLSAALLRWSRNYGSLGLTVQRATDILFLADDRL